LILLKNETKVKKKNNPEAVLKTVGAYLSMKKIVIDKRDRSKWAQTLFKISLKYF
jgi:hypothetical protein